MHGSEKTLTPEDTRAAVIGTAHSCEYNRVANYFYIDETLLVLREYVHNNIMHINDGSVYRVSSYYAYMSSKSELYAREISISENRYLR